MGRIFLHSIHSVGGDEKVRFFRSQIALFHINIANTVSNIAPGIPNVPTTSDVITFIPICNPHIVPTMLITYNNTAPKNEFIINLVIIFIGIINIFPTISIPIIHATYTNNILTSMLSPISMLSHSMFVHGQIWYFIMSFILIIPNNVFKYALLYASYFIFSILLNSMLLSFAFFIKKSSLDWFAFIWYKK